MLYLNQVFEEFDMIKSATKKVSTAFASAYVLATVWSGRAYAAVTGGVAGGALEAKGDDQPTDLFGATGILTKITNTLLFAVGIVSVFMLIYGGLRYITSGGDTKRVTDAKNTVMYAIIGLIIAVLSYAIINFVITSLGGGGQNAPLEV
jgi:cytochrome bd-type quinol oxidase subunit 2